MALTTLNLRVQSGECVLGLRVIEIRDRVPIHRCMALLARLAEASLVLIGMAGNALARNAQERAVEILNLNRDFICHLHSRRRVTFGAGEACVLTFESPTRF